MNRYRVTVTRTVNTNGWVEVEAEDENEAFYIVDAMDGGDIEDEAEWGSCGDTDEYFVDSWVELVHEPTVNEGLWN